MNDRPLFAFFIILALNHHLLVCLALWLFDLPESAAMVGKLASGDLDVDQNWMIRLLTLAMILP